MTSEEKRNLIRYGMEQYHDAIQNYEDTGDEGWLKYAERMIRTVEKLEAE